MGRHRGIIGRVIIGRGQVPTITKAFPKVETRSCYQIQTLSITENKFFFDPPEEAF
jgi:hypothetical protein